MWLIGIAKRHDVNGTIMGIKISHFGLYPISKIEKNVANKFISLSTNH